MQPTIICTAPAPGMVYLNGRFAGEAGGGRALVAPVSPCGALYLEYRPLTGAGLPLARKCVFSGGMPLVESLAGAAGLFAVAWPGGAVEIELAPAEASVERFALEGLPCALARGEHTALTLNGVEIALPAGAGLPRLLTLPGAAALMGEVAGGGQYLAALAPDLSAQTGLVVAGTIEPSGDGLFTAVAPLNDTVGHGRLEQWLVDGDGARLVSSESVWYDGAPRWPQTAEGAMLAAVEAALAGLDGEVEGYLSPALAAEKPLAAVGGICDACAPMRYGAPDARPCVALLRGENAHLATARPLYYRAEPAGGRQGPWQITSISLE